MNACVPARSLLRRLGVIAQDGRQHFRDRPGRQVLAVLVFQVAMPRPVRVGVGRFLKIINLSSVLTSSPSSLPTPNSQILLNIQEKPQTLYPGYNEMSHHLNRHITVPVVVFLLPPPVPAVLQPPLPLVLGELALLCFRVAIA